MGKSMLLKCLRKSLMNANKRVEPGKPFSVHTAFPVGK